MSGFHVDPGYAGRLKFSVYNAGSGPITISRGERMFLIWYTSLDGVTADLYGDAGPDQDRISSEDQNIMHGEIASPAELGSAIKKLENLDVHRKWILTVIAGALVAMFVRFIFMDHFAVPSSDEIDRLKTDIMTQVRKELEEVKNVRATPGEGGNGSLGKQPANESGRGGADTIESASEDSQAAGKVK